MGRGVRGGGLAYAERGAGRVLVLRAAPRLDAVPFDVEQVLPSQLVPPGDGTGLDTAPKTS